MDDGPDFVPASPAVFSSVFCCCCCLRSCAAHARLIVRFALVSWQLPQYIISDFNTFVCTACSGIHREFSHRVKSISLATFTEEEVAGVKAGGNEANNKLYMARHAPPTLLSLTHAHFSLL